MRYPPGWVLDAPRTTPVGGAATYLEGVSWWRGGLATLSRKSPGPGLLTLGTGQLDEPGGSLVGAPSGGLAMATGMTTGAPIRPNQARGCIRGMRSITRISMGC